MFVAALVVCAVGCSPESADGPPADGLIALGTWGGDSAGVIVDDTIAHIHIACTFGDMHGRITLDSDGRFTRTGSYLLRAYPVAIGPTMPASFSGRVYGSTLIMTVTVSDTIDHTTVVRGPISVRLGITPRMGPCPICRTPGDRASAQMTRVAAKPTWYARVVGFFSRR